MILKFREEFEQSGISSIDAFIARRPAYQQIGELAIAAALVPIEEKARLSRVGNRHGDGDWYQMVWNEMLIDVTQPDQLLQNRVRFITFNYDRSLEQYLLGAIQSTFGLQGNAAFAYLAKLSIKHVYGSLGEYDPQDGYGYGGHQSEEALVNAIRRAQTSIKTVPAVRPERDHEAASWLAAAQRIFIMGFGFDPMNCARIGLPGVCSADAQKATSRLIFASAYELTEGQKNRYRGNAGGDRPATIDWVNGDCLTLLRVREEFLN